MTEPSPSQRARALQVVLELTPKPSAFDRQRIRARIETVVEGGTFSGAVQRVDRAMTRRALLAARMGHISAKVWLALWLAPTFLLGFGAGVLWGPRTVQQVAAPREVAAAAVAQSTPVLEPPSAAVATPPAPSAPSAPSRRRQRQHQRSAQAPALAEPAPEPPDEAVSAPRHRLAEELRLMRAASDALESHDYAAAGRVLSEHEQRFASGALAHERKALRLIALCKQGSHRAEVAAFLNAAPASPLVARVREACAVSR
ncbi:MAG: hypothetical protein RL701_6216 [Pseudomonadota bacterium]